MTLIKMSLRQLGVRETAWGRDIRSTLCENGDIGKLKKEKEPEPPLLGEELFRKCRGQTPRPTGRSLEVSSSSKIQRCQSQTFPIVSCNSSGVARVSSVSGIVLRKVSRTVTLPFVECQTPPVPSPLLHGLSPPSEIQSGITLCHPCQCLLLLASWSECNRGTRKSFCGIPIVVNVSGATAVVVSSCELTLPHDRLACLKWTPCAFWFSLQGPFTTS